MLIASSYGGVFVDSATEKRRKPRDGKPVPLVYNRLPGKIVTNCRQALSTDCRRTVDEPCDCRRHEVRHAGPAGGVGRRRAVEPRGAAAARAARGAAGERPLG